MANLVKLLTSIYGKDATTFKIPLTQVYFLENGEKQILKTKEIYVGRDWGSRSSPIDWDETSYKSITGGSFRMKGSRVDPAYILNFRDVFKIIFEVEVK